MSGTSTDPRTRARRMAVRAALFAAAVGLAALVFVTGKGHTLLIDNKDAEDGSALAIDGVMVSVDRQEALELYSGDRDRAAVMGQVHTISIEIIADGTTMRKKVRLPIGKEMLLLSVPKLAAGLEPSVIPFVPAQTVVAPEEGAGESNAFTSPGGAPEAAIEFPEDELAPDAAPQ
jgi:hypothetical protein